MVLTRYYWQDRLAELRNNPPGTEFSLTIFTPDRLILGDPRDMGARVPSLEGRDGRGLG
jgi:hypothetical protein